MKTIIIFAAIGFLAVWLRHRYIQWQEDKEFWRQVDKMFDRRNKIFIESFKKTLEDMNPYIIDLIKKNQTKKNGKSNNI
jgi:hypothetical protein